MVLTALRAADIPLRFLMELWHGEKSDFSSRIRRDNVSCDYGN